MKKPSEENISQSNSFDEYEAAEAAPEAQTEAQGSEADDDVSGYKFLKSKPEKHTHSSSDSHHSSGEHSHHHHRRRRRRRKKMKTWKKVVIIVVSIILALAIVMVSTFFILKNVGQGELFDVNLKVIVPPTLKAEVQDDGDYIVYKGATYKYNTDITSMLFMGVDKRSIDDETEQGTGGQADAIVMMAMNMKSHKITLLAVPRDTITEVALYTPSGHYSGMKDMQVCMAYAYGDGKESSCENMVSSVRRIFYNVPIKTYYALDLDGIAAVNDSVGGVDVVSPETIGAFTEGESYHLEGKQAERFVRDRDKSQVDSSMKRLERQKVYAKSFLSTMSSNIKKDVTSAVSLFNESAPYSCTNLNAAKVAYLATEFASGGGMSTELVSVPGKLSYENELATYRIDESKFFEQFLSVYYERIS